MQQVLPAYKTVSHTISNDEIRDFCKNQRLKLHLYFDSKEEAQSQSNKTVGLFAKLITYKQENELVVLKQRFEDAETQTFIDNLRATT